VVASTIKGQQAALASPGEAFVLLLHRNGMLNITERATGRKLFSVGPFSGCQGPFQLAMLASGQMVLQVGQASSWPEVCMAWQTYLDSSGIQLRLLIADQPPSRTASGMSNCM
jgi:hypothetical protein